MKDESKPDLDVHDESAVLAEYAENLHASEAQPANDEASPLGDLPESVSPMDAYRRKTASGDFGGGM